MRDEEPIIVAKYVSKKFCLGFRAAAKLGLRYLALELLRRRRRDPELPLLPNEFLAIRRVSLRINRGESIGIVGRNGSGKTTLARVLAGIYKPDAGIVTVRGRVVALFAKGAGFAQSLSGYENIFVNMAMLGLSVSDIRERLPKVIEFADLPEGSLEAPVKTYSSGMKARLSFACAVHTDPELMIIDESLAVGDLQFRTKCYNRLGELRRLGVSFVIVSHNLKGLLQICDRALYLHNGKLVSDGPAAQVIQRYRRELKAGEAEPGFLPVSAQEGAVEKVRLCSLEFRAPDGGALKTGRPAAIVVECEAVEDVENLTLVAIVKDGAEELGNLATLDSALSGARWDLKAGGRYRLKIEIPALRLIPGEYHLKLFVAGGSHHNMLDAIEKYPFEVAGDTLRDEGLFHHEASVSDLRSEIV